MLLSREAAEVPAPDCHKDFFQASGSPGPTPFIGGLCAEKTKATIAKELPLVGEPHLVDLCTFPMASGHQGPVTPGLEQPKRSHHPFFLQGSACDLGTM